jgi:ethanolamine utilization protein EutJ
MEIKDSVNQKIQAFEAALSLNNSRHVKGHLFAGVDLGTAYIVTAVVDSAGTPVVGALTRSGSCVRDGLVLDYMGAVSILRKQVQALHQAGFPVRDAAAAYPPGTAGRNANVFRNVLEAAGLEVAVLTDEPSAAGVALEISEGAVVDIGGGTTGISVIRGGKVVYTADEPTGGTHVDLVLAGHFKISDDAAEAMKRDTSRQEDLFPLISPVFEKMASIVNSHLADQSADTLYLVGGTSGFPGIDRVMERETGLKVLKPLNPLLVTPLGIALSCLQAAPGPDAFHEGT